MKVKSKVRQLRFELQTKEGRAISMQEVADASGMDRDRINRIELGKIKEIKTEEIAQLCKFFTQRLGRPIGLGDLFEYDPEGKQKPELVGVPA